MRVITINVNGIRSATTKGLFDWMARQNADVVCLTDCHLFSLSKETFDDLVRKSPRLREVIENRIRSYSAETPPVAPRGVTSNSAPQPRWTQMKVSPTP